MAHNTKKLETDVDGKAIPQYYNKETDQYEPLTGNAGASKVIAYDANGNVLNPSLHTAEILDKLDSLAGTAMDEEQRKANESTRELAEQERESSETLRETAELQRDSAEQNRQTNEVARQNNYQELLATGVLQTKINDKLLELETQYAPTLLEKADKSYVDDQLNNLPDLTWDNLQDKPLEFTPIAHTHTIEDVVGLRAELDSVPELTKENVGLGNVDNVKQASKVEYDQLVTDFSAHQTEEVSQSEVHGLRVQNEKLEYYTGTKWKIASGGIPVGNVERLSSEPLVGKKIELKWQDPSDRYLDDDLIAEWEGTKVIRKTGNYPNNVNDGELAVDNTERNKYSVDGFVDEGLQDGEQYYYMLFPYTADIETIDGANRTDAKAFAKFNQDEPTTITVSDISHDRATITSSGAIVSLNQSDWFDSPHEFVGLTAEMEYTAYAKFEETDTHVESDVFSKTFETPSEADDTSGSPGSKRLIAGDMQAGFFGEVPASELFTASQIASDCGITQGTAQHENEPWLKFAYEGKILFRPRKAIRHSISWNSINTAKCVYGDSDGKIVTKDGKQYRVRLMRGSLTNPTKIYDADRGAKGSEWNKLMLPIHEQAINKSWAYPAYVERNVPIWAHSFGTGANGMYSDADLVTHRNHGNGSYVWQQETPQSEASSRISRGNNGVSLLNWPESWNSQAHLGWAPVLELL